MAAFHDFSINIHESRNRQIAPVEGMDLAIRRSILENWVHSDKFKCFLAQCELGINLSTLCRDAGDISVRILRGISESCQGILFSCVARIFLADALATQRLSRAPAGGPFHLIFQCKIGEIKQFFKKVSEFFWNFVQKQDNNQKFYCTRGFDAIDFS